MHCDDVKYFEPADVVADDDRLRDGWPGIVVDLRCVAHAQQQHSAVVVAEHLEYPASRTETPLKQIVKEDAYVYECHTREHHVQNFIRLRLYRLVV